MGGTGQSGGGNPQHTTAAATLWLTEESWALSIWRGEVDAPDRLRIDARDGSVHELRLERNIGATRPIKLGRAPQVGAEVNDLVFPDVASRLAATFRHDGTRWWIFRREECSVPVEVGARSLNKNEEAPLVHGVVVIVGGMRAIFADRRFVTFSVPAGAVDPITGLLGRTGLELELAIALRRKTQPTLLVARDPNSAQIPSSGGRLSSPALTPLDKLPYARFALAAHRTLPTAAIAVVDEVVFVMLPEKPNLQPLEAAAREAGMVLGLWPLRGGGESAGRELELALAASALKALNAEPGVAQVLRDESAAEISTPEELIEAARSDKRMLLLFGIEEQHALDAVGRHVLAGLQEELAAVVKAQGGPGVVVSPLARGVIGAAVPRKQEPSAFGYSVQSDWHSRPPVVDGRAELPRALSWEITPTGAATSAQERAAELSRECADPAGVLSSLGGGLPYPIASRVAALSSSRSGVERVKMLFDVLEGTWRFMAAVICSAYLWGTEEANPQAAQSLTEFLKRNATRDGYPLGTWREATRHAATGLQGRKDAIATMARDVMEVKLSENQTFDTLSNLLQAERNAFAHGQYTEANAATDLPEFEQVTRTLLRALRPLSLWTLVTVERTEPDMYGEQQMVEFIDHTGPSPAGVRRRLGLMSAIRLANVTYLARWREGIVLPLEPMVRRVATGDRFDLYWMDHLPRPGQCTVSAVSGGQTMKSPCDPRRLPPQLRKLLSIG
ncbi:MAG: hypothetical protein U0271_43510 [Polyangiaceae bacterium]